ncbi:MAG: hypothetical protein BZY79_04930 [SAR202 cluster bacterium Casp-Chloro-G4]|nr:MAG: hypothetical protein BZY79_04930 [SAR202 cluster bacterium Casp-Chloro-G4]
MPYKAIYLFLEGNDDITFFHSIVKPLFERLYDSVISWPYRQRSRRHIQKFIKAIDAMGADYVYVGDIDSFPCVTRKKESLMSAQSRLRSERIYVVKREIEGWYIAGASGRFLSAIGAPAEIGSACENRTKEQFNDLIPRRFQSRIDFMQEVLKDYDVKLAADNNPSFRYFLEKNDLFEII